MIALLHDNGTLIRASRIRGLHNSSSHNFLARKKKKSFGTIVERIKIKRERGEMTNCLTTRNRDRLFIYRRNAGEFEKWRKRGVSLLCRPENRDWSSFSRHVRMDRDYQPIGTNISLKMIDVNDSRLRRLSRKRN